MQLSTLQTDDAVLQEIGRRVERHRLERNLTQAELAAAAGVGRATLQRLESGESVQMTSLVKLIRALGLLEQLDAALPEDVRSPIAELERQRRKMRRRVRHGLSEDTEARPPWRWGDSDDDDDHEDGKDR